MPSAAARSAATTALVDRIAVDAGHGGDRLGYSRALDKEDRPDQVIDRQGRLAHQPAGPVGPPVSSHAPAGEDFRHVRLGGRTGRGEGAVFGS